MKETGPERTGLHDYKAPVIQSTGIENGNSTFRV